MYLLTALAILNNDSSINAPDTILDIPFHLSLPTVFLDSLLNSSTAIMSQKMIPVQISLLDYGNLRNNMARGLNDVTVKVPGILIFSFLPYFLLF
jgi:hypothetical protein